MSKIKLGSPRDIARGIVPNQSTASKFGYNKDLDSAAAETIRSNGGAFSPITAAETLSIVSDSASDDDGSTGCEQVTITGLDASYNKIEETVTLDGITPVLTTNAFIAVNRCKGISFGSGQTNAGNITVTQSTSGAVMAYVVAGVGVTQQLIYTIPAGLEAMLTQLNLGALKISGGASPRVRFLIKTFNPDTNGIITILDYTIDTSVENSFEIKFPFESEIAEKSTIWIDAETDTNNTEISGRFYLIMYSFTGDGYTPYS